MTSTRANERNGEGWYISNDGVVKYSGQWQHGKMEGKGVYFRANGDKKYDGQWKGGLMHGKGVYFFHDRSSEENPRWRCLEKVVGQWEEGQCVEGVYFDKVGLPDTTVPEVVKKRLCSW